MNRSCTIILMLEFNQYLIMMVIKCMTEKEWWSELNYRIDEIKGLVTELESISGPENQSLAAELLERL